MRHTLLVFEDAGDEGRAILLDNTIYEVAAQSDEELRGPGSGR
jgi:hypothetical protein